MDPLNLILLIIVVFIGLRLRSVLGRRDDDETPSPRRDAYRLNRDAFENKTQKNKPRPLRAVETVDETEGEGTHDAAPEAQAKQDAPEEMPIGEGRGLAFLRDVEPDFDESGFLQGAERAYEMILTAFADGDLSEVRGFLGDDVAAGFDAAIEARRGDEQQLVTRILRLDRPALDDAHIDEAHIALDVRFRAELISFTQPLNAAVDEDNLPAPATALDVWRFARARKADGQGWVLVATQSA